MYLQDEISALDTICREVRDQINDLDSFAQAAKSALDYAPNHNTPIAHQAEKQLTPVSGNIVVKKQVPERSKDKRKKVKARTKNLQSQLSIATQENVSAVGNGIAGSLYLPMVPSGSVLGDEKESVETLTKNKATLHSVKKSTKDTGKSKAPLSSRWMR